MTEFSFRPRHGEEITVSPSPGGRREGGAVLTVQKGPHGTSVDVWAHEVPFVAGHIATAMHEAAGLPAPLILDRPAIPGTCFEMFGTSFSLSPDGSLRVTRVGGHLRAGHQYEPSEVRRWAGYLAALADEAERRQVPDPELVRQMTADLHAAGAGIKDPELLEVARRMALMGWRRDEDGAR